MRKQSAHLVQQEAESQEKPASLLGDADSLGGSKSREAGVDPLDRGVAV